MLDISNVAVLVPALNEERSLRLVLGDLPAVGRAVVVDNGSTDRTAEVAEQGGAIVVREPRRGYGAACLAGMEYLRTNPPAIVVFLDADYSDYPEQIDQLVAPIASGEADFVLGSRLAGSRERGAMPPQSVWGNRFACWLMRILWKTSYTDLGPFRAIRWDALESLGMCDRDFGWTIEMQIKAAERGLRTLEIPVAYRRRIGASKISGTFSGTLKAGSKILYIVAKYGLSSRRRQTAHRVGDVPFEHEEAAT
jgi:glycosyltransferase involved in cell wall biosynthesis